MDQHRLAALTRWASGLPYRRDVVLGLASAGLGPWSTPVPEAAARKQTRRRKVRFNAFGCVNVGSFCTRDGQCCSGVCEGKQGKRRCRAHDAEGCTASAPPHICDLGAGPCTSSLGDPGFCQTTTGKAGYCAAGGMCHACATDAECRTAQGGLFGPRAACVRCAGCEFTGGTACAGPKQILGVSQAGFSARAARRNPTPRPR